MCGFGENGTATRGRDDPGRMKTNGRHAAVSVVSGPTIGSCDFDREYEKKCEIIPVRTQCRTVRPSVETIDDDGHGLAAKTTVFFDTRGVHSTFPIVSAGRRQKGRLHRVDVFRQIISISGGKPVKTKSSVIDLKTEFGTADQHVGDATRRGRTNVETPTPTPCPVSRFRERKTVFYTSISYRLDQGGPTFCVVGGTIYTFIKTPGVAGRKKLYYNLFIFYFI